MKVIMNVPDEGYSRTYLMKVIMNVPDEGYYERTWWRLFKKRVVHTKGYIYIFISWQLCVKQQSLTHTNYPYC
jgi:hypothetical protein